MVYEAADSRLETFVDAMEAMHVDMYGNITVVQATGAIYFGPIATDGTWRIIRNGTDLRFERREAGVYVEKSSALA